VAIVSSEIIAATINKVISIRASDLINRFS